MWTDWHLIRELLRVSSLKEGAAGAVECTVRNELQGEW
jgi:hypothetical protein